ncbi:MAG: thioredoxin-like domain-containing protein [Deltaproteobacteria bacterium]
MIKLQLSFLILAFAGTFSYAQHTITGEFPVLKGSKVILKGFNGFDTYLIDSSRVNDKGVFMLKYSESDIGMGILSDDENRPYIIVLSGEDIRLKGELISMPESVSITAGEENLIFAKYAAEHPRRQQILSAWEFLKKKYETDSLFISHSETKKAIETEIGRLNNEDHDFLRALDKNSYMAWYLPVRKLVGSIPYVAQYKTEDIPATIAGLRKLDYTDKRLWKSGTYREALEGLYWLIENMGKPLDSVYREMNIATDHLIANLSNNEEKLNIVTNYLFGLLEKHSLFEAAEYLSVKVLTQNSCTITDNLARQLETYRAMKKGNTAPDIFFADDVIRKGIEQSAAKLSEIKAKKTLVVFGASWCPNCKDELSQLSSKYELFKSSGIEVLFVSLDTDKEAFTKFSGSLPFTSICDYKKWDSKAAKDYFVIGTPTMFLLDNSRKILLRPNSVKHLSAWLESNN